MTLNNAVADFIEEVTGEKLPAEAWHSFAYGTENQTIYYAAKPKQEEAIKFYLDFVKAEFETAAHLIEAIGFFVVCLLHEIGHYKTDYDSFEQTLPLRRLLSTGEIEANDASNYLYFNMVDEHEATAWAINFIQKNIGFCLKWREIFLRTFPQ